MEFTKSWLGYDMPHDLIENDPAVRTIRTQGVEKRIKAKEYHVTVAYFDSVSLESLAETLARFEAEHGPLTTDHFSFDGYGAIRADAGAYVYFSPSDASATNAKWLKERLAALPLYDQAKNCRDLHLSIGGPDPFCLDKPKTQALKQPIETDGRLIFVGHDGRNFRRFSWNSADKKFEAQTPALGDAPNAAPGKPFPPQPVHTLAVFPKIQADTATAIFLLKSFGEKQFPGITEAKLVFWTAPPTDKTPEEYERDGYLLLDLGGRFDHHVTNIASGKRNDCLSTLIARALGMEQNPILKKLLAWAKRDDLEGKGTVSPDPLDRAFGLSGIIMNLNREFASDPEKTIHFVMTILKVHVNEEYRRHVELPQEWEQLQREGKARLFKSTQGAAELKGVLVHTDNIALPGFLRAAHGFDIVAARRSTGHTSIMTKQERSLDLRPVIAGIRMQEAQKKDLAFDPNDAKLTAVGKYPGLEEWYYDDAANSLQNGGVNPQGIAATKLDDEEILIALQKGLPRGVIGSLKRQKDKELTRS